MLLEVCREISNLFIVSAESGTFKIQDGILTGNEYIYPIGTYIAIERRTNGSDGSLLNAGIYKTTDDLITLQGDFEPQDEVWNGSIYMLAIPKDFLLLVEQISEFQNNPQNRPSANVSESFGIDSRTKAVNRNGVVARWQDVFRSDLAKYPNKMFMDIYI